MSTLILPVGDRRTSSWGQHQRRNPKSSEPGTDFYCPTGTEVLAPADGVIYGFGTSVTPATGRWVGVNFDNGMSFRCMHHSRLIRTSGRVRAGDVLALSGSSGYGSEFFGEQSRNDAFYNNTGGDHTHVTLWPTWDHVYGYGRDGDRNKPFTVDFMEYVGGSTAGGNATPIPKEWDEMVSKEELTTVVREVVEGEKSLLFGVNKKLDDTIVPGIEFTEGEVIGLNRKVDESILPTLEREAIRAAALSEVVKTLAVANGSDPAAIEAAIERGVERALSELTLIAASKPAAS